MKKLLLLPALLMLTAGCGEQQTETSKTAPMKGRIEVYVDTLDICGHSHEMLYYGTCGFGYRMMHSPECWCGKEVTE